MISFSLEFKPQSFVTTVIVLLAALIVLSATPALAAKEVSSIQSRAAKSQNSSADSTLLWSQTAPVSKDAEAPTDSSPQTTSTDSQDQQPVQVAAATFGETNSVNTDADTASTSGSSKPKAKVKAKPKPQRVGESPSSEDKPPEVPLLANVGGVLTPRGKVAIEPFLSYSRSSVNTFTFQGVQILPAFLIGQINAVRTARDLVTAGATFRAGVTNRLEVEAKVPYVARHDAFTNIVPNTNGTTVTQSVTGYGIGDVEVAGHYQVNEGQNGWPFFVGNMRFKTDTGTSPYEVPYQGNGSPAELATGSGFLAVEPSLTIIYPSDPAVLFGNIGYIHSLDRDINRNIAGNFVGNVEPGDTYSASAGVGLSLNDRLSLTFGYQHDYVRPTLTQIGGATQESDVLQVGSALTGLSLKASDNVNVNLSLAAGVTRDAPDAQVTLRVPITFRAFGGP